MKIPETSANVGAYYGNEDNVQWQPNGIIIDSGVGGGVVGSGDAGVHRPVYPVHIPRGHIPAGYVMAGAFYPPAAAYPVQPPPDDFEDYMWMENEEEFDKQVMQQLEEEALMEQCIEAMLEDEQRERRQPATNGHSQIPTTSSSSNPLSLEETVSRSTLNPLAAEFVPTAGPATPSTPSVPPATPSAVPATVATVALTQTPEDKTETTEPPTAPAAPPADEPEPAAPEPKAEVTTEPPTTLETPEVSAADVTPADKRPKDTRRDAKPRADGKKLPKVEAKAKAKPQVVRSEPKVPPKKKELKLVKSETKLEDKVEDHGVVVSEAPKPQPAPVEEPATPGFKPINYAAAARANKPKKPATPPADIPPPLKTDKDRKSDKRTDKQTPKAEKVVQRKNSAKSQIERRKARLKDSGDSDKPSLSIA